MNYYEHHLGDYLRDTVHLTWLEDAAYRRLLDSCYIREAAVPRDLKDACRLVRAVSRAERDAVKAVLEEYFELRAEGWVQKRCEAEILRFQDKQRKAKASAEARWSGHRTKSEGNANASDDGDVRTHTGRNALQSPDTRPQSPKKKRASSLSPAKLPTCPVQALIDVYHEVLPELPRVRLRTKDRVLALQRMWAWVLTSTRDDDGSRRAQTAEQAIDYFRAYCTRVRANDHLMNRAPRPEKFKNWKCDLDFLLTERGMKHVIEKTAAPPAEDGDS